MMTRARRGVPRLRLQASSSATMRTVRPAKAAIASHHRPRPADSTATRAQPEGTARTTVLNSRPKPSVDMPENWIATYTIHPDWASTIIAADDDAGECGASAGLRHDTEDDHGDPGQQDDDDQLQEHAGDRDERRHQAEPGTIDDHARECQQGDGSSDADERRAEQPDGEAAPWHGQQREMVGAQRRGATPDRADDPAEHPHEEGGGEQVGDDSRIVEAR